MLSARHHLDINIDKFNNNKFLFNLDNVTYDLKTLSNKSHDFKDHITLKSKQNMIQMLVVLFGKSFLKK